MTHTNPDSGNALGLSEDHSLAPDNVKARIAAFCKHFAVDPPGKLKTHRGKVCMTDDLLKWCDENGASIDWICIANPNPALAVYRDMHLREGELRKAIRTLDDAESKVFFDALTGIETWLAAHRAQKAGAKSA